MSHRKRHRYAAAVVTALAAAAAVVAATRPGPSLRPPRPPGAAVVAVQTQHPGPPIPPGFLGLSLEFPAVTAYAGTDPRALNPVFLRLVESLAPGQRPVLRIGGDSTDWTWWPARGIKRPPGVHISLTPRWMATAAALQRALNARLILGINLEAGTRALAGAEAAAFTTGLRDIEALEPGNEPELYPTFGWYLTPTGHPVPGRPAGYDFAAFTRELIRLQPSLRRPLAAPATGSVKWMPGVPRLVATVPQLTTITLHRYPLQRCFTAPDSPTYPTVANLLSRAASQGLADSVASYARLARARHLALRIDEMNTISCGDSPLGHSPATALWVLDALFAMARAGVTGVNVHTYPGAPDDLFQFTQADGRWTAHVEPEYYGMLLFARAAPAGARLLPVSTRNAPGVKAWATEGQDGRVRLVVINDSQTHTATVAIADARPTKAQWVNPTPAASLRSGLATLPPDSAALISY